MRPKGIKGIALLVAAVLLLVIPMVAIPAAGGEERGEGFRVDARYWWEDPYLTAYEREQVKEIMVLVFDRYFGTDVSAMSPEEFEEVVLSVGPEPEEIFRLFTQYAEKRGFEIPGEIPEEVPDPPVEDRCAYIARIMAADVRYRELSPADVTYWWELVGTECREATVAAVRELFPEIDVVDVVSMSPDELNLLLNPPPPPLRLLSIEERREKRPTTIIAIYGRPRTYESEVEVREWLGRLRGIEEKIFPWAYDNTGKVIMFGVCHAGYLSVGLNLDRLTRDEALAFAAEAYPILAEMAKAAGVDDVPVVFELWAIRTTTLRHERIRPIDGGIRMSRRRMVNEPGDPKATTGIPVRCRLTQPTLERGYTITGHMGFRGENLTPINMQVYQPRVCRWWPWRFRAGRVADVGCPDGGFYADVARVAFDNVDPHIRTFSAGRTTHAVWG